MYRVGHASLVRVPRNHRIYRHREQRQAFENGETTTGAADLFSVARAGHVALAVWVRGSGKGQSVTAVAFRTVFDAEVHVAVAESRAGFVGVVCVALGFGCEGAVRGGVGHAAGIIVAWEGEKGGGGCG